MREPFPSAVDVETAPHMVEVHRDRLTVAYRGHGHHTNDFGTVRANCPVPSDAPFYYFEVRVVSAGELGCITIGVADRALPLEQQPGSTDCSFGYCGEDGQAYPFDEVSSQYGPSFSTGDVVGCGIIFSRQEVFFTKNGRSLGPAYVGVVGELYPVVSMHSPGEQVELCFDPSAFYFSLSAFRADEALALNRALAAVPLQLPAVEGMVEEYLAQHGFAGTLEAYRAATSSRRRRKEDPTLDLRHRVRLAVVGGDADRARAIVAAEAPQLAAEAPRAIFLLACQRVIDLVSAGSVERALQVAVEELAPLRALGAGEEPAPAEAACCWQEWHGFTHKTEQVMGLFAYAEPGKSPLAGLLSPEHRLLVADALNGALAAVPASKSRLERCLLQLQALKQLSRDLAGGRGAPFSFSSAPVASVSARVSAGVSAGDAVQAMDTAP